VLYPLGKGSITQPLAASEEAAATANEGVVTDSRSLLSYIPILNLFDNTKFLPRGLRTIANAAGAANCAIALTLFVLRLAINVVAVAMSGPIGWLASLITCAIIISLCMVMNRKAAENSENTWKETGYQIFPTKIPPSGPPPATSPNYDADYASYLEPVTACYSMVQKKWRNAPDDSLLIQRLLEPMRAPHSDSWSSKLIVLMEKLGFGVVGLDGSDGATVEMEFFNEVEQLHLRVAIAANGEVFFQPHISENSIQEKLSVANVALGFKLGQPAKLFSKALSCVKSIFGNGVTLTGRNCGGTFAQFLAFSHGLKSYTFNSFGIGATMQHYLGNEVIAARAGYVVNFVDETQKSTLRRAADFFDPAISIVAGLRTPGSFGRTFDYSGSKDPMEAIGKTAHLQAEWRREHIDEPEDGTMHNRIYEL
jgi:hypothetical protein